MFVISWTAMKVDLRFLRSLNMWLHVIHVLSPCRDINYKFLLSFDIFYGRYSNSIKISLDKIHLDVSKSSCIRPYCLVVGIDLFEKSFVLQNKLHVIFYIMQYYRHTFCWLFHYVAARDKIIFIIWIIYSVLENLSVF